MNNSPPKPHFFKAIYPGFKIALRIPNYFFENVLSSAERRLDEALLKNKGQEWRVEVLNQHFVGDGWIRFAAENNLELGDFAVLKHHGNMVFAVQVFDGVSQCKREDKAHAADISIVSCHFTATITSSTLDWGYLCIPRPFAKSSGLMGRKCEIIVKDELDRSWFCNLSHSSRGDVRILRGGSSSRLVDFFDANGFKKGDHYKFELLCAGGEETPVVRILPMLKEADNVKGKGVELMDVSETESGQDKGKRVKDNSSYFTSTIKIYNAGTRGINIPMDFARKNGLLGKRGMILMDKRGGRWPVSLVRDYCHLYMSGGWKAFVDGNEVKEGDVFRFEIVELGPVPVLRFTI